MSDFEQFLQAMRWTAKPGQVDPGEPRPWDGEPIVGLPELSSLLATATVTPVVMGGQEHQLLAFGPDDARRGWLTLPGFARDQVEHVPVHPLHKEIVTRFGGIGDVFGVDDGWWSSNHRDILTSSSVGMKWGEALASYAWIWEDDGLEVPVRAEDYYVVAAEMNGNLTVVHREDGHLLLFAPDHAYDGVTGLDGCPEYSLYTIDDVPDFTTWVETNAEFWHSL